MTVRIVVTFPFGTYEAASTNRFEPEWPPSPARLLSGLRAGARTDGDLDALRWLERQGSPRIVATPTALARRREQAFVVTNRTDIGGLHQRHPGRTATLRRREGAVLREDRVSFVWSDAQPPADVLADLDKLAARLPYLGRSTSVVIAVVDAETDVDAAGWFEPTALARDTLPVAAPYVGMIDALQQVFETGGRAWEAYRAVPYRYVSADSVTKTRQSPREPATGPFREFIVFGFAPGVYLDGGHLGHVTTALRKAVMSRVRDPLPTAISGHDADERAHAAYLGLPFVDRQHADGHLVGVAVALPKLEEAEFQAVARGLVGEPRLRRLSVPKIGEIGLSSDEDRRHFGSTLERWCRSSTQWVTATPIVLDRHPHRHEDPADVIAAGCVTAGYPKPLAVEVHRRPLIDGGVDIRPHQVPRRQSDRRPYLHARITFDRHVRGPVLIGALRYLGLGLCVPTNGIHGGARRDS